RDHFWRLEPGAELLAQVTSPLAGVHPHDPALCVGSPVSAALLDQRAPNLLPHRFRVDEDAVEVEHDSFDHGPSPPCRRLPPVGERADTPWDSETTSCPV